MVVDCLAHLNDARIVDPQPLLTRAAAAGVRAIVTAGVDPLTDAPVPTDSAAVHRALGIHPRAVDAHRRDAQLSALVDKLRSVAAIAVGEIGLDARKGTPSAALQESALREQLLLARHLDLPVLLHCVGAPARLLQILADCQPLPSAMLHGFAGPADMVPQFARLGCLFSFGGLVTRSAARRCRAAAAIIPEHLLLVESDTPDHPPVGAGPLSEPAHILRTVSALAELRGTAPTQLAAQLAANAERFFGLRAL